ncbi:MAG: L-histidine N(alpha)-methyltransferase [Deltaproteobacteria bacterium]|nr:L-histidine N(alpha)-methyltransferase [Deltaproteobacteria bacterium]
MPRHAWDFSDPVLTYSPAGARAFAQLARAQVARGVYSAETRLFQAISPQLMAQLPHQFTLIDLGPGIATNSGIILQAACAAQKLVRYVPVDCSRLFLNCAARIARRLGVPCHPIHSTFEAVAQDRILNRDRSARLVLLGLTYTNFWPDRIHPIIKAIMGPRGATLVSAQPRERVNISKVRRLYESRTNRVLLHAKLHALGLSPGDIASWTFTDEIRVYVTLRCVTKALARLGLRPGDRLLFNQSLRHPLSALRRQWLRDFHLTLFDHGGECVAALLRPRHYIQRHFNLQ